MVKEKINRLDRNTHPKVPLNVALIIGALGVVFGDIGTSPLYAVNEAFFGMGDLAVTRQNVFGVIGLIFWLLTTLISVQYMLFVLRADNQGEGGVISLHTLLRRVQKRRTLFISVVLVFAASLLFGEAIITPAISVLSAVEGLRVGTSFFEPYIISITIIILALLFTAQRKGTAKLGKLFGPVMVVWFLVIGALGLFAIIGQPEILQAVNPIHAFRMIGQMGAFHFLLVLGAVTLAITGVESLYADLGHFGVKPIRYAWFFFAYWALIFNYFGQGAALLSGKAEQSQNVFFSLLPQLNPEGPLLSGLPPAVQEMAVHMPLYLMVGLATLATITASQALISGMFSIASQAIALKMAPRMKIIHTNAGQVGQIYVPAINWALFIGCVSLVLLFHSSDKLAAAYGMAVAGVMLTTNLSMFLVSRDIWHWPRWKVIGLFGPFLAIVSVLFLANSLKFLHGGYIPVVIGIVLFSFILIWRWGRNFVHSAHKNYAAYSGRHDIAWLVELKRLLETNSKIKNRARHLVELDRAVIFLESRPVNDITSYIPTIIRIYIKRHGGIPRNLVILTIIQDNIPFVDPGKRIEHIDFGRGIHSVKAHYGFMQRPDGEALLHDIKNHAILPDDVQRCSIESANEDLYISKDAPLIYRIRAKVFYFFEDITQPAYHYFRFDRKPGLSQTVIPIILNKNGWRIDLPEFAFDSANENIDPDQLIRTDLRYLHPYGRKKSKKRTKKTLHTH